MRPWALTECGGSLKYEGVRSVLMADGTYVPTCAIGIHGYLRRMSDDTEELTAVRSTWERRDLPILEQVVDAFNRGERVKDARRLADLTGLDAADALLGLEALHQARYVDGVDVSDMQTRFALLDIRPLERARRATGDWLPRTPTTG